MKLYPFCANAGADSTPADKMIAAINRTMRSKATSRCRFCVWNNAALIGTIMQGVAQAQSGATYRQVANEIRACTKRRSLTVRSGGEPDTHDGRNDVDDPQPTSARTPSCKLQTCNCSQPPPSGRGWGEGRKPYR